MTKIIKLSLSLVFVSTCMDVRATDVKETQTPQAQFVSEAHGFEDGAVPSFVSTVGGELKATKRYSKSGAQSLEWAFKPNATLTFKTGDLGNINVFTGYNGYSRSALVLPIRTNADGGKLVVRFMSGDSMGASFDIPLVFDNWQRLIYPYSLRRMFETVDSEVLARTDRIEIQASSDVEPGSVYVDDIQFNTTDFDHRLARAPLTEKWMPVDISDLRHDPRVVNIDLNLLTNPITEAELDAIKKHGEEPPSEKTFSPEQLRDLRDAVRKLGFSEPFSRDLVAKTGATPDQFVAVMSKISDVYLQLKPSPEKEEMENLYFQVDDYLRAEGAIAQGSIIFYSYGGRRHAEVVYRMRDAYIKRGKLETVLNKMKYDWQYARVFDGNDLRSNCDFFYINARYWVKIALMHEKTEDRVIHLRLVSAKLSALIEADDCFKPDGSLFHHGFHHYSYGGGASIKVVELMAQWSDTPFKLSNNAYNKLRKVLMQGRWYANTTDLPLSLHGRAPGQIGLLPDALKVLGDISNVYTADGQPDPSIYAAYLRLVGQAESADLIPGETIKAEAAPQGHSTMPFAGLTSHRRGEWLALVRGYGKHWNAFEAYANANRHGRFFANGHLEILGKEGLVASGTDVNHGLDWRQLNGTTTFLSPLAVIANGNGTAGERGAVTFMGGLSHRNWNGAFVFPLKSSFQGKLAVREGEVAQAFTANKTYFFFDNSIVCLGSDIHLANSDYEVVTTLFQKTYSEKQSTRLEINQNRSSTLLDTQNTGYYVPGNQDLQLVHRYQESRDGQDKNESNGNAAVAYLSHGLNPENGSYAYIVMPDCSDERLQEFSKEMDEPGKEPVHILAHNGNVHLVFDRDTKTWGAVFFGMQMVEPRVLTSNQQKYALPVQSVAQACLMMIEHAGDVVHVSYAHPGALDDEDKIDTITLRGQWAFAPDQDTPEYVKMVNSSDESTELEVTTVNGGSVNFSLVLLNSSNDEPGHSEK